MSNKFRLMTGTVLALAGTAAQAHPGGGAAHDLWAGFLHPLTGLDHLLVLVLLGAWFARSRAGWPSGLALMAGLAGGVFLAGGALPLAATEGLVLASLPVAAAAAASGARGPAVAAFLSAGLFFHGQAHALAFAGAAVPPVFIAGLALGSLTALVTARIAAGRLWVQAPNGVRMIRDGQ